MHALDFVGFIIAVLIITIILVFFLLLGGGVPFVKSLVDCRNEQMTIDKTGGKKSLKTKTHFKKTLLCKLIVLLMNTCH